MPPANYRQRAEEWCADLAWLQWNRLGIRGSGSQHVLSTDIEVALLFAAQTLPWNPRLLENIRGWLETYGTLIQGERLGMLITSTADEALARRLGGLLSACRAQNVKTAINACRRLCQSAWQEQPLVTSHSAPVWLAPDPAWQAWGYLVAPVIAQHKLDPAATIMARCAQMRMRAMHGATTRTDVLYLLWVSQQITHPTESDRISAARLGQLLGCHPSTLSRLAQDLLLAGAITRTSAQAAAIWNLSGLSYEWKTQYPEQHIANWADLFAWCHAALATTDRIDQSGNEQVIIHYSSELLNSLCATLGIKLPATLSTKASAAMYWKSLDLALTSWMIQAASE